MPYPGAKYELLVKGSVLRRAILSGVASLGADEGPYQLKGPAYSSPGVLYIWEALP